MVRGGCLIGALGLQAEGVRPQAGCLGQQAWCVGVQGGCVLLQCVDCMIGALGCALGEWMLQAGRVGAVGKRTE